LLAAAEKCVSGQGAENAGVCSPYKTVDKEGKPKVIHVPTEVVQKPDEYETPEKPRLQAWWVSYARTAHARQEAERRKNDARYLYK
jgi:hypothetical protein